MAEHSRMLLVSATSLIVYAAFAYGSTSDGATNRLALPQQAVTINPLSFAVIGENGTFRESSLTSFFNPTNTSPPFFQVFDPAFLDILGPHATIRVVASNPGFAFAHEAPIWNPETDDYFFASNCGGDLGFSDLNHNSKVGKISLKEVARAIRAANSSVSPVNVTITELDLPETIQMTNGGTGLYHGNLLLATSGRGPRPPSIALVNPNPPYNATVILDNFFGRQFNSLDDIKVHPKNGKIFFTDVTYGFLFQFRSEPLMPNQVYRFDPATGSVRVVADGMVRPNGLAFTGDGKTVYVTDTGVVAGIYGNNQTDPATIYQFDVDPRTHAFVNRRVFAYIDTGVPDGIQVDTKGNVYSGCGDGVQVWNSQGTLIGKFFLGTTSSNMLFAGKGRLLINAETNIFLAEIAAEGLDLASFH